MFLPTPKTHIAETLFFTFSTPKILEKDNSISWRIRKQTSRRNHSRDGNNLNVDQSPLQKIGAGPADLPTQEVDSPETVRGTLIFDRT